MIAEDPRSGAPIAPFRAPYALPDEDLAAAFLNAAPLSAEAEARVDARAGALVLAIRAHAGGVGGVEDFLREYSLSTKEGLALMVLAEALLRVPDAATADSLIEDKLTAGDFAAHETRSGALLVSASAWALGISARVIGHHETPEGILHELASRLGRPAVRSATRQAMRLLGSHFVLGQTIAEALSRGAAHPEFRYSFDMLGEGARTRPDAERYFAAYADALAAIGKAAGAAALPQRPGISVKLSALHPRYEAVSRERVMAELVPRVIELARSAKTYDLNLTVDAEEADRLELSLDIFRQALADPSLAGWDGFGLAVQAYQKRAPAVIDWVVEAARATGRRLMVRLVKGAYWDTEVKRAQERGLADYPVFSRKAMTDLCYLTCARKLLAARPQIYPQIATHNALTVASVIEAAGGVAGLRVPAPLRHGRDALRGIAAGRTRRGLPGLRPGRRAPRSARLSGAAAAGERRQFVVRLCGGGPKSAADRDPGTPAGRHRQPPPCAPPQNSPAARPLWAGADEFGRHRVRARGKSCAAVRRSACRCAARGAGDAADRRHCGGRTPARGVLPRSMARRSARSAKATRPSWPPPSRRRKRAFRPGTRPRWRRAPPRWSAPPP